MKWRVLHEPTRTWATLSLPTSGCRDRAEGPRWGACGHQVPKRFTNRQVLLCGLTPGESGDLLRPGCRQWGWGTQTGCYGASYGLCWAHRYTWGHTHTHRHTYTPREKCHVQTWTHLCLSEHKRGLRTRVVVRHLGPLFPSPGTLAAPLKKPQPPTPPPPNGSTENKQAQPS